MIKNAWKRLLLAALLLLGIGIILLLLIVPSISTVMPSSCISAEDDCLRFPSVSGDNLSGRAFTLPEDFAGDRIFVVVPFDETQQREAAAWLPLARELATTPRFVAYNVPTFPNIAAPVRAVIRAGLNIAITDPDVRDHTITLFLDDRDVFLAALNIPNPASMHVFLLNENGEVLWRGMGAYSEAQGDALREALMR